MGSTKRLQVLLLLVLFVYLCVFSASSSIIQKGLSPESSKDNDVGDKDIQQHEHGIRNDNGKNYAGGGITYGNKIAHVGGVGSHTWGSPGRHGNNGGSGYLYGGGAANNHDPRTHHGTSSCNRNTVGLFSFILTTVAPLARL